MRWADLRSHTVGTVAAAVLLAVATAAGTARGQPLPVADSQIRTNDLIRLATTYAEAVGEIKIAKLRQQTLEALRVSAPVTSLEIRIAEINVSTAEQKLAFLRKIAQKELNAAQANLEMKKQLWKIAEANGADDARAKPDLVRAEAEVEILQMILDAE
jgi:hypothetical protein